MTLLNSYVQVYGQLAKFFDAIRQGQAPEKFTRQYLKDLGFKSSNHHALIPLLKGLGFSDRGRHADTEVYGVPRQISFEKSARDCTSKKNTATYLRSKQIQLKMTKTSLRENSRACLIIRMILPVCTVIFVALLGRLMVIRRVWRQLRKSR